MEDIRYFPVIDNKPSTELIKNDIQNSIGKTLLFCEKIEDANCILVVGGDGFMLDTIKKYHNSGKLFFGINYGTLGFLLNNIGSIDLLPKNISQLDIITETVPRVDILHRDGDIKTTYAINDIVLGKSILDYFSFHIYIGDGENIKTSQIKFKGTGLIVSTPIGSTAYRLSNGGPILPLNSNLRGLMGIASLPFRYKIVSASNVSIKIKGKSKPELGLDGYGEGYFNGVSQVQIKPNSHSIKIGFAKDQKFKSKRILIAQEKL